METGGGIRNLGYLVWLWALLYPNVVPITSKKSQVSENTARKPLNWETRKTNEEGNSVCETKFAKWGKVFPPRWQKAELSVFYL